MYALETILALTARLVSLLNVGTVQRVGSVAYYNPALGGGSMLNNAEDGYGEPLNVIISGESSPGVLTEDGIVNYARAIGFSEECFNIHLGTPFPADLGDGNGWVNQTTELRQDYGSSGIGTCLESLIGGNHFRIQGRGEANVVSYFTFDIELASDQPVTENHDIIPDGYDIGRDNLVAGAIGETNYGGVSYSTQAENITGLLAPGTEGVNHGIAQDGVVTLLTVKIV
ncbi:hypothetical protein J3R83DRAFT_2337 [Lanmaoa asiatica]|nr:hypothetical protein J3R83DRAFT_2337 [Lanmaoa asiatica]